MGYKKINKLINKCTTIETCEQCKYFIWHEWYNGWSKECLFSLSAPSGWPGQIKEHQRHLLELESD